MNWMKDNRSDNTLFLIITARNHTFRNSSNYDWRWMLPSRTFSTQPTWYLICLFLRSSQLYNQLELSVTDSFRKQFMHNGAKLRWTRSRVALLLLYSPSPHTKLAHESASPVTFLPCTQSELKHPGSGVNTIIWPNIPRTTRCSSVPGLSVVWGRWWREDLWMSAVRREWVTRRFES